MSRQVTQYRDGAVVVRSSPGELTQSPVDSNGFAVADTHDRSLAVRRPGDLPSLAQPWRDDPRDSVVELDLYDLLKGIVERTPWRSEEERLTFERLLERLHELNVFGSLASTTTVQGKR